MTYPLRQRTAHEFLYYLLSVRVHGCAGEALRNTEEVGKRQLITKYHQLCVCNESESWAPSRVRQLDMSAALLLLLPPPPRCLFLYMCVSWCRCKTTPELL